MHTTEKHLGWRASRKVSHVDYLVVSTSHALDAINRIKQFLLARLMQERLLRLWLHAWRDRISNLTEDSIPKVLRDFIPKAGDVGLSLPFPIPHNSKNGSLVGPGEHAQGVFGICTP